jgi:hypothetical protein
MAQVAAVESIAVIDPSNVGGSTRRVKVTGLLISQMQGVTDL